MSTTDQKEKIHTRIWLEQAEPDNPFAAAECYCSGYNVYGDLLGKASWVEYLYLLFKLEKPAAWQVRLLEGIAIAIANPGPRDYSVRAAMNAGVGGSTHASALMAALAVGAGSYGGAREVWLASEGWQQCKQDIQAWQTYLAQPELDERADVWPRIEHPPGFDPYGASCTTPVKQTLDYLVSIYSEGALAWIKHHQVELESIAACPLAMSGVIAAAFYDLGMNSAQSEMLFLLLRLPGAAAHALEQEALGWRTYPFFKNGLILTNDPGPKGVDKHADE